MHEVELVRRVWTRLREGYDYDTSEVNHRAPSQATVERVVHTTLKLLGISIRPDGSVAIPEMPSQLHVVEILPWTRPLVWETVAIFGGDDAEALARACVEEKIPDGRAQAIRVAIRTLNGDPIPAAPTLGDLFPSDPSRSPGTGSEGR